MPKAQKHFILITSVVLSLIFLLSSCMTYTHEEAKQKIAATPSIPEVPPTSTKLVDQPGSAQSPTVSYPAPSQAEAVPEPQEERTVIRFTVALVPLPIESTEAMLDTIISEVEASQTDIIGFTGNPEALIYVGEHIGIPIHWTTDDLLLATTYPIELSDSPIVRLRVHEERSIRLSIIDLHESHLFQVLYDEPQIERWSTLVEEADRERGSDLVHLLEYNDNEPIIVLASLGEPSSDDWFETTGEHPYRTRLRWPLSEVLGEHRYLDSWRLTHHNAISSPGITWQLRTLKETFKERVDYLFQRGLLPIETNTIPISLGDMKKFPYEQRSAVTGTFVVP